MSKKEKKSLPSTKNTKLKFTRGHEILLTGLIGSGMNYRDIFHLEMALITEKDALTLAIWIRDELDKRDNQFPAPEEILLQAKTMFPQYDFSTTANES
jgi:hypothetical protein